jgi:hypothetical protein
MSTLHCVLSRPWVVVLTGLLPWASAHAGPVTSDALIFQQRPMIQTLNFGQNYFGHDEQSTAFNLFVPGPFQVYSGSFMADDFAVKSSKPISHVRWWGSYLGNVVDGGVNRFLISFETDVPQAPVPFSRPGQPLLSQIVGLGSAAPSSGSFAEQLIHPGGAPLNEGLYEYNAALATPFVPDANTVYWLKIVALVDPPSPTAPPPLIWGWHNRDYTLEDTLAPESPAVSPGETGIFSPIPEIPPIWHFQDDAVSGDVRVMEQTFPLPTVVTIDQSGFAQQNYRADVDGPPFIAQSSKDLAFELYAIPEPATASLLAIGLSCVVVHALLCGIQRGRVS